MSVKDGFEVFYCEMKAKEPLEELTMDSIISGRSYVSRIKSH